MDKHLKNNGKSSDVDDTKNSKTTLEGTGIVFKDEKVDIFNLCSHPFNNYEFTSESVDTLAMNIKEVGLLEPPYLRQVKDGTLQILSGRRRIEALKQLAKQDDIWRIVKARIAKNMDDGYAQIIIVSQNLYRPVTQEQRKKLTKNLNKLVKKMRAKNPNLRGKRTGEILAKLLGTSPASYNRSLRLQRQLYPDLYHEYYNNGLLPLTQAWKLCGVYKSRKPTDDEKNRNNEFQEGFYNLLNDNNCKTRKEAVDFYNKYMRTHAPKNVLEVIRKSLKRRRKQLEQLKNSINNEDNKDSIDDSELKSVSNELKELNTETECLKANIPNYFLNTILYGPPGTGKTFNTVAYAVAICEETFLSKVLGKMQNSYKDVIERFNELKEEGRIEFVTFHQSFAYEEFVEGIRPILDSSSNDVQYTVESGVFKRICTIDNGFEKAWEDFYHDVEEAQEKGEPIKIKTLANKPFPLTTTQSGFKHCDIDGGFFNHDQCLNVYQGKPGTPKKGYDNYRRAIVKHLKENYGLRDYRSTNEPRVIIIDEINRGNISKIFGELITLIEESKRVAVDDGAEDDCKEAVTTTLPYSGEEFGVPSNVYILGTMNTADRSIALMDTALRRRFDFVEMMPDPNLVSDEEIDAVNVRSIMEAINKRIELLYDREHTIGHSYFMGIESFSDLRNAFEKKIVPLLQEYFYDDYEKIRLVLGDNLPGLSDEYQFICEELADGNLFYGDVEDYVSDKAYHINTEAFENKESYIKIYSGSTVGNDNQSEAPNKDEESVS